MKINQNISAVIVNDKLLRNENSLAASVERLSSGLKFNNAKDSPSGMAISFKMQAQINALNRASANTTDGASMIQTIDGATGEITSVMQRIRELCVQGANGTNKQEDLEAIQKEIDQLKKEVDRISSDTEFNGMKLLDGSKDRRTYVTSKETVGTVSMADRIQNVIISDEVQAGKYEVTIEKAPTHATTVFSGTGTPTVSTVQANEAGTIRINGVEATIKEGMTPSEVYEAIREAGRIARVNVFPTTGGLQGVPEEGSLDRQGFEESIYEGFGTKLAFVSEMYGSQGKIDISSDNDNLSTLVFGNAAPASTDGEDVIATINKGSGGYSGQAVAKCSGDEVIITDKSGFEISFEVRADILVDATSKKITIDATDIGTLQLQIGANEDQELAVRVPVLTTRSLYIDDLDVTKKNGASMGIAQMDRAIGIVSAARAKVGAYQNRLEYAEASLDETAENMTSAISRLGDVDMAEEMTNYTNTNILTQASISVLAQANDLPQQVLSLLQG